MIAGIFRCHTRDGSPHAQSYIAGLLSRAERKNMERLTEELPEIRYENLQQFLSSSPWKSDDLWRFVAQRAVECFDPKAEISLLIDESGFAKKGPRSAGVARQYNGRLGKVDNAQVGVFSALSQGHRCVLTGARLYLPEEWTQDPARCEFAGIPKDQREFKTKNEIAWSLIEQAESNGIRFEWVGADEAYGRDQDLLLKISGLGKPFMVDVAHNQQVWETCPPGNVRPDGVKASGSRAVAALWEGGRKQARNCVLRLGENGKVKIKFWRKRVWIWPPSSEIAMEVWLCISVRADGTIKYSISNAPEECSRESLAHKQGQRYFIERALEDGKSELGMGEYQARKWIAWHHHMSLVGAAMIFALIERQRVEGNSPLTSVRDVVEMVAWYFAESRTAEEVVDQIKSRHKRRAQSMKFKLSKQLAEKRNMRL